MAAPAGGEDLRNLIVRLAERSDDVIYRYRLAPDRGYDYVSPAVALLTGYAPEEYYADPDLGARNLHPDDRAEVEERTLEATGPMTFRLIRKDGSVIWAENAARVVTDDDGQPVALEGVARDVTERKRAEEALQNAAKMEAVGRLAGGVAHDFNNQLAAIRLYCDLALAHVDDAERTRSEIQGIVRVADLASQLTAQLLAFGRRQVLQVRVLDLNVVVQHAEQMLQRLLGKGITLDTELSPALDPVLADPAQLEQVIVNVALNARDAMPRGGTVTIRTANAEREGEPHVLLAVSDNGVGMDESTQSHLFEPFFSTKEQGEGTGLGLATVYGIVSQSGGTIDVESEPDSGSTFSIYLPRSEKGAEARLREEERAPAGGSETLLLVEDEEAVRAVTTEVLVNAGYRVLAAAHGGEALELGERHQGEIDAVVTDVLMPGLGGPELVERLRERFQDLRIVYMSGFAESGAVSPERLTGATAFVQKPFSAAELGRAIRAVLDA